MDQTNGEKDIALNLYIFKTLKKKNVQTPILYKKLMQKYTYSCIFIPKMNVVVVSAGGKQGGSYPIFTCANTPITPPLRSKPASNFKAPSREGQLKA